LKHTIAIFIIVIFSSTSSWVKAQVIEKNFVTTDKTIYAPEDTVWFKAYVFDRAIVISDQSIALHVLVADAEGNKKVDTSWPILQGITDGYFLAPREEGQFIISAISGQMIGSDTDLAFKKAFYVRSDLVDDILISAFPQFDLLNPDGDNTVNIFSRFSLDKRAPRERLRYQVLQGEEVLQNGRLRTNTEGKVTLNLDELKEATDDLVLIIESDKKDLPKPIKLTVPLALAKKTIDLQLFPEGGRLVAGVANRIAVKAIDQQGEPFGFKALLMNQSGQVLDTVSSFYAGMGSFNILPTTSQLLRLEVIEPAVRNPIFEIGEVQASGVALSIVGEGEQRLIRLLPNQKASGETFIIEISQFDQLIQATDSKVEHRQFFKIPWENLAPGLVKVTLIQQGVPYSERIFFNEPSAQLNIDIQTDKETYTTREKVNLDITVTDDEGKPVIGSFSLAAIDAVRALSPAQEQANILASLLLTSEIKGTVPNPNFYFSGNELAVQALDLVTLTNGYRKYISSTYNDSEAIVGYLYGNASKRKLLQDRTISLIAFKDLELGSFNTDETGKFTVPSSYLKNKGDTFIISSPTIKEKDRFSLVFDDTLRINKVEYFKNLTKDKLLNNDNDVYQHSFKLQQDRFNSTILLNSVTVESNFNFKGACELQDYHFEEPWTTKKVEDLDLTNNSIMNLLMQVSKDVKGYGAGYAFYYREKENRPPFFQYVDGIVSSIRGKSRGVFQLQLPFRIYLNCEEVKDDYVYGMGIAAAASFNAQRTLEYIDFSNLESVSVYLPRTWPLQSLPKIEINTINDVIIRTETFQKVRFISAYKNYSRESYSPKYDTPEKQNDLVPDLRTTIFWNANLVTDENGKATVSYYNADRANPIRITLEGVDQQSHVGTKSITYQVKEKN
jgi:hypothetical protein